MKTILVALALGLLAASATEAQDQVRRLTRIHLRNGSCVEGQLAAETPRGWTLRMPQGEMMVRRDQVERVETIRMKSLSEPPAAAPAAPAAVPAFDAAHFHSLVPGGKNAAAPKPSPAMPPGQKAALLLTIRSGTPGSSADAVRSLDRLGAEELEEVTAAICDSPDESALSPAQKLLESTRGDLRASGVRIIAAHGGPQRRFEYRSLVEDSDPQVRRSVIASLASLDDITAFDLIGFCLVDPDAAVRAEARTAVFRLSSRHHKGDELVRLFLEKLYVSEGESCAEILSAIGTIGAKEAWETVARHLHERSAAVRAEAALALARIGVPESADALLERLGLENEYWPRIQLAGAVGALRLSKAVDPLLAWMEEDDENIRMAAVRALRQITRQSFGMDRDRWVAWWQDAKPRE